MKRLFILALIVFCVGSLLATQNRVATMGGEVAMLPDDDSNIDLFPQRVNDWSIVRFEDIQGGSPDYLLITGKKGNKWGFYGGQEPRYSIVRDMAQQTGASLSLQNYFFNIYRSMSSTSALKLGLQFGTISETEKMNNNDSPEVKSEETNKYTTIGIDAVYGFDSGKQEMALCVAYMKGPGAIYSLVSGKLYGNYEYSNSITNEGTAGESGYGFGAALRKPSGIFIFDNTYGNAMLVMGKQTGEYTANNVKQEDWENSIMILDANLLFFSKKMIAGKSEKGPKALLVYGMGCGFQYGKISWKNNMSGAEEEDTDTGIALGGPRFRVGIEAEVKSVKLRFGIQRNINLYASDKYVDETVSGTNNDTDETTTSGIGVGGNYTFASGIGMDLGKLTINLMLNNTFWCTGPQMIFNSLWGTLGVSADVVLNM